MAILDEFIKSNLIDRSIVFDIEKEISEGKILDSVLEEDYNIEKEKIFEVKKSYYKFPIKEYKNTDLIENEILDYIPKTSVEHYKIAPLGISADGYLEVGMLDPDNPTTRSVLQFISSNAGMPYRIFLISLDHYNFVLSHYSGLKGEVSEALGEYGDEVETIKEEEGKGFDQNDIIREDAPIAKIVKNILKYATDSGASDVHIEPKDRDVGIRYRVDGILEEGIVLPKNVQLSVIARIKILSNMKLDERRRPQDGRFSVNVSGKKIDFRVSTFPTYYGEKVVMRLLKQDIEAIQIEDLGFSDDNLSKIKRIIKKHYGIIVVCGPTGSGKTSTLYSLLNEIDKEKRNVVSLENPIELNVKGVSQSQIREDIGYTFSSGLRTILRQDPDIIMVGEVRDSETAKLAIQAALTGHLVLSTIHTNTAADVPQRLIDMGVEPYLIGPTLLASIGQRLVRKICAGSENEIPMPKNVREKIDKTLEGLPEEFKKDFIQKTITEALPTDTCPTGMRGRTAVFEILETTKEIRRKILKDPSSLSIFTEARNQGFITFKEDAIKKALEGKITIEEAMSL